MVQKLSTEPLCVVCVVLLNLGLLEYHRSLGLLFFVNLNDNPNQCGGGMQCCHERQRYRRIFSPPEVSVIQATLVLVKELQAIECWFHSNHLFTNTAIKD